MLEELTTKQSERSDPLVNRHGPASTKSQDISHVLACTFKHLYTKDIIGKDTLANLVKTNKGRSSYHDRYVEELQQAYSEYSRCIKEADMLESHIIQARARAATKESHAIEMMTEGLDDVRDNQCLRAAKSAFPWCIDEALLQTNNLISPQDYKTKQKKLMKPPAAEVKPDPARPTISTTMRVSRGPQDDGYTLIPSPEKKAQIDMSDLSLSLELSSCTSETRKSSSELNQAKLRPKWMDEPSTADQSDGSERLRKLKEGRKFLRNPRFLPPNAQRGSSSLIRPRARAPDREPGRKGGMEEPQHAGNPIQVFLANPPVVMFTEYSGGNVYEMTLELKNVTSLSRHLRVIPPTTPYFSISLGKFPGEGGDVAPGMSCRYAVRFAPDALEDYQDFIMVETQAEQPLVVPIKALRPPPVLTLPRSLDCGYCLIGGVKIVHFLCENIGRNVGTFCIVPKSQWPAPSLQPEVGTHFSEQPAFTVSPPVFTLQPREATEAEVVFSPTAAEKSCEVFIVVCDNLEVNDISITGDGQRIALELVSVSGEMEPPAVGYAHDTSGDHFVCFSPCNPQSQQEKRLVIRNNVHLELRFHWRITKPNERPLPLEESAEHSDTQLHPSEDVAFHICPISGILAPCQTHEFLLTFCPTEVNDYHSVCHLVLRDVPQQPPAPRDNGLGGEFSSPRPGHAASKTGDVIAMEIKVKGPTEPYQVRLEPYAIVIPGELFIFTTIQRKFKMWNHSKTSITFQWEKMSSSCHVMDVEPSTGQIEMNGFFDFDLIVTGGKPERVVAGLFCHIKHHYEVVTLSVDVSFKGPTVTLSVPSLDFGLIKVGEQSRNTLLVTNITNVQASWMLEEVHLSQQDNPNAQVLVEPNGGVLPPLASCSVDVLITPHFCQQFETELELKVENGTGCHLLLQADVQVPQLCLLNCELVFSELYLGVPAQATVTLFNQTQLQTNFSWMAELQGQQASLCTASFYPSSGTLGPHARMVITVDFATHTGLDVSEVAAVCEVEGMNSPLVLGIAASRTKSLSVSYSLPSACCPSGIQSPSTLTLDFGDDVIFKRPVIKQLLITNQTAIPAPFAMEAEYFTCHASKPSSQSEQRFAYVKKPLHTAQAKKVEEKAHIEFVSSLLAHGKGAAFLVRPNSGMLGAFETKTVDVTAYSDMWGEYRDHLICRVGNLEPTLIPMRMTVKGCPLYFQMIGPRPDNQNQGPIMQFGTHVSGGDTVSRCLRINNPSTFDIRLDWEIYNIDPNDRKLVDVLVLYGDAFPVKDADGNELRIEGIKISHRNNQTGGKRSNSPSSSVGANASLQSMTDVEWKESLTESEDDKTGLSPCHARKKLLSVLIRPHIGNRSDFPFCLTPQQIVIPARGSNTIQVTFTPVTLSGSASESRCVGLVLGFINLDSEMVACVPGKVSRVQGLDLDPIKMDLQAFVKRAMLLVQMEEDDGVLEFHASASDLLMKETQEEEEELIAREFEVTEALKLKNTSEMPVQFTLWTQPPFSLHKLQPHARIKRVINPSTGESQYLVLEPQQGLQVKVDFRCSLSLLDHADQADQRAHPGVRLIHLAAGRMVLKFQQNLLIQFSNSSQQIVPLCAQLKLPTLSVSSDSIDFGVCYVRQTQTREVDLCSLGDHTYWRSKIEEGDSHVFRVMPNSGFLKAKTPHASSSNQRLQISFTASADKEFTATLVIQSPVVKTPVSLRLRGTGAFDEAFKISNQM